MTRLRDWTVALSFEVPGQPRIRATFNAQGITPGDAVCWAQAEVIRRVRETFDLVGIERANGEDQ